MIHRGLMKYLHFLFTFITLNVFYPLHAQISIPPVGSFLMREAEDKAAKAPLTPREKHEKRYGSPTDHFEHTKRNVNYVGATYSSVLPVAHWYEQCKNIKLEEYIVPIGISIAKRYSCSCKPKIGHEYRFDIFPLVTAIFKWPVAQATYQRLYYSTPERSSTNYYGLGIGISGYQGIPLFLSLGREFNRFGRHPGILEFQISSPLIFVIASNISVSYKIGF